MQLKINLKKLLSQLRGFKFVATLGLVLKKIESEDKRKYGNFYSSSKAEIINNARDIDDVFQSIYTTIVTNIQISLGNRSGWIIDSVTDHTISISRYNPLAGNSYIKLSNKLNHPGKGLINIQNSDYNGCFRWSIFRYLNPADRNPERITEADKDFSKKFDFKDIKFPIKIRDIQKTEKKNSIGVFGYKNKVKHPIYYQKHFVEKRMLIYC